MYSPTDWIGDLPNSAALRVVLRELKARSIEVVLVGPAPMWKPDLPTAVYAYWREHRALPDRLRPVPHNYAGADAALKELATSEDARFVSLSAEVCNQEGCLTHIPDDRSGLLSWDYGHLTTAGAKFAVKAAGLDRLN